MGELPNSHGRTLTDKSYVIHGIRSVFDYVILPLIAGILLLYFLKEQRYSGIIFCAIPILIYQLAESIYDVLLFPEYYKMNYIIWRTKLTGIPSLSFSLIGSLIAIYLNRKRFNKSENKEK